MREPQAETATDTGRSKPRMWQHCPVSTYFHDITSEKQLTYSMEQSHSNRFPARQEIPRILRKPKVHHRSHKCKQQLREISRKTSVPEFSVRPGNSISRAA